MRILVLAVIAISLVARSAGAGLSDRLTANQATLLRPLVDALAQSVAKLTPTPAASSGITFTFDPASGGFVRDTEILGQLLLERARPIGRGKLNLGVSYQWVPIDSIDGHPLDDLARTDAGFVEGGVVGRFETFDLSLVSQQTTFSVTYGLTDDLELNLVVPLIYTAFDLDAVLLQPGTGFRQRLSDDDGAFGVGDVIVRAKQRLLVGAAGTLAAGLALRLPSGDRDDFQGTGTFGLSPALFYLTPTVDLAPWARLQGYASAGIDFVPEHVGRSDARFGVGADLFLGRVASLSVAFLAREAFEAFADRGAFDVPQPPDGTTRGPLFGLETDRVSQYDLAVGGRVNLWRDTVFGVVNVLVPLNEDGVRTGVVPLVGVEIVY